jgi:hypothetical protein
MTGNRIEIRLPGLGDGEQQRLDRGGSWPALVM